MSTGRYCNTLDRFRAAARTCRAICSRSDSLLYGLRAPGIPCTQSLRLPPDMYSVTSRHLSESDRHAPRKGSTLGCLIEEKHSISRNTFKASALVSGAMADLTATCSAKYADQCNDCKHKRISHALFLCHNRKGEVEKEPLKTKQARNLKSSAFTRMAQQHHYESLHMPYNIFRYSQCVRECGLAAKMHLLYSGHRYAVRKDQVKTGPELDRIKGNRYKEEMNI